MICVALWPAFLVSRSLTAQVPRGMQEDEGEPGVITGKVVDENCEGVSHAKIYIEEVGKPRTGVLNYVLTDPYRRFRFDGLRISVFSLIAVPEASHSNSFLSQYRATVQLTEASHVKSVTIHLRPKSIIEPHRVAPHPA